MNELKLFC